MKKLQLLFLSEDTEMDLEYEEFFLQDQDLDYSYEDYTEDSDD
jgi:hypothetical protein